MFKLKMLSNFQKPVTRLLLMTFGDVLITLIYFFINYH